MYSPAFLILSIALFACWLLFFIFSRRTRKEQVIMSAISLILAPAIIFIALSDYRAEQAMIMEPIGLENILFIFSVTGIAAVIYHALLDRHMAKIPKKKQREAVMPILHWIAHLLVLIGVWAVISMTLMLLFPITSVYGFLVAGLLVGIYILAERHDLLLNALLSGLFLAALIFALEQVVLIQLFPDVAKTFWQTQNLAGVFILGIPVEEILWAAVVGFTIGPAYEFVRGYRLRS